MINKDGKTVSPTRRRFHGGRGQRRLGQVLPGFYVILTNSPGDKSWPIAGATFILIHKQPQDPAATREALKFFAWAYKNGDKMAGEPRLRSDAGQRRQA